MCGQTTDAPLRDKFLEALDGRRMLMSARAILRIDMEMADGYLGRVHVDREAAEAWVAQDGSRRSRSSSKGRSWPR